MAQEEIPKGFARVVLLSITNKTKTLFYLQKKDETYPLPEGRLAYTFFGGHILPDEDADDALKREISEELEENISEMVLRNAKKIMVRSCNTPLLREFHLYEAAFSDKDLDYISRQRVNEGKGGFLIAREQMNHIKIIPAIVPLVKEYLDSIK
jgi:8-oxo-dGTP pyrophosphatase MutT (NUDIX family)